MGCRVQVRRCRPRRRKARRLARSQSRADSRDPDAIVVALPTSASRVVGASARPTTRDQCNALISAATTTADLAQVLACMLILFLSQLMFAFHRPDTGFVRPVLDKVYAEKRGCRHRVWESLFDIFAVRPDRESMLEAQARKRARHPRPHRVGLHRERAEEILARQRGVARAHVGGPGSRRSRRRASACVAAAIIAISTCAPGERAARSAHSAAARHPRRAMCVKARVPSIA